MATPTLLDYRRRAAKELTSAFVASTATSASTISQLVDTTWPINSTLSQDDLYSDYYLLRPAAALATDKVRIVKTYTPSGGIMAPDTVWTNAPANGEAYELHGVLEPQTQLLDLINEALKRCGVVVEFTIQPSSTTAQRESLANYPWILQPGWVRKVGRLVAGEARSDRDPYLRAVRGDVTYDGGTLYLNHEGSVYNTTDTLYVTAIKRAYDHCGATTAVSAPGAGSAAAAAGSGLSVGLYRYRETFLVGSGGATETAGGTEWTVTTTNGNQQVNLSALPTGGTTVVARRLYRTKVGGATNTELFLTTIWDNTTTTYTDTTPDPSLGNAYPTVGNTTAAGSQSGLTLDTDTCPADTRWVAWATIVEAWRSYAQVLETSAKGRLNANRGEAAAMFTRLTRENFVRPELQFRPLRMGGPYQTTVPGHAWL